MSIIQERILSRPTGILLVRLLSDKGLSSSVVLVATVCTFYSLVTSNRLVQFGLVAFIIVKVLYAGTLFIIWTTASSLQRLFAQLATLYLVATLTIAARCYAKTVGTQNFARFEPTSSSSLRSIDNSNVRPHSSTVVLNRATKNSITSFLPLLVRSNISKITVRNYNKSLLTNQKARKKRFRTKRELRQIFGYNRIVDEENKRYAVVLLGDIKVNLEKRSNVLVASEIGGVGDNSDNNKVNSSIVNIIQEAEHQNDSTFIVGEDPYRPTEGTERPMPPVHDHDNGSSVSDFGILVLLLSAIVLTVALGLITCVLSHYHPETGEGAADGGTAADPHDAAQTPTTAPMLSVVSAGAAAGVGGMDRLRGGRAARELAATRDRQLRLHAVHRDIAINLPPNIAMPDGEEHSFTSSRLHIRDPEQESEIHQKCIRPPPNRTVLESESPPPYRSSSVGLLGSSTSSSSSGGGGDWSGGGSAPLVVRCHSMSSTSSSCNKRPEAGSSGQKTDFLHRTVKIFTGGKKGSTAGVTQPPVQTLPVVIVPARPRRTSGEQQNRSNKPSV